MCTATTMSVFRGRTGSASYPGLVAIFALFQWIATALHSDRGQAGVIVALTVVSATLIAQRWLYGGRLIEAAKSLGLGMPRRRGLAAACASCASLAIAQTAIVTASGAVVTYDATSLSAPCGPFCAGRRRRRDSLSRLFVRGLAPTLPVLAGVVRVDDSFRRGSFVPVPHDAVARRDGFCSPRGNHEYSAVTPVRAGWSDDLGAGATPFHDSERPQDIHPC